MPQILIIADDLTGAADTGAAFAKAGWSTLVLLDSDARLPEADVLVVSTESRDLAREEATARVRQAVRRTLERSVGDIPTVYKKIDSTLRGHPGAELGAVMGALDLPGALVAPAFPAQGRTTRGGRGLVDGVPVEDTPFGREVACSDLLALFGTERLIDLNRVRRGPDAICQALDAAPSGVVVADAETDADLAAVARAALRSGPRLWCGSAGLARALAELFQCQSSRRIDTSGDQSPDVSIRAEPSTPIENTPSRTPGSVLVVAGSGHPRTARQVEVARGWGAAVIQTTVGAVEGATQQAARRLADGEHVILTPAEAPAFDGQAVAEALGTTTQGLVAEGHVGGLVLTGGETAAAICAALGASALWLRGETQPGIAWGVLLGGVLPGLPVVTKAGGFGADEALAVAIGRLGGWKDGELDGWLVG
jgi:uncharacterized protein YgbK (DUF1537 family)